MNLRGLSATLMIATVLTGCAAQQAGRDPIVDMKGVDPVQYEEDLAVCKQYAEQVGVARDTATGALVGAAIGGLAGAAANDSDSAKRAAGVGAVVGGAHGAFSGIEERDRVIRSCLRNRGYAVLN